jgi:hypothetical protein
MHIPESIGVNDLVLARNFERTKGQPRWVGPFLVSEATVNNIVIKNLDGRSRVLTRADVKKWNASVTSGEDSVVPDNEDVPDEPSIEENGSHEAGGMPQVPL